MSASRLPAHSSSHSIFLLIDGQWVCFEKGLSLDQANVEAVSAYRRCRVPTEIRERNGKVVERWEPAPGTIPAIHIIRSSELLQGASEILIEHRKTIYRLRAAAGGKLILQK
jgi:hemin uptake protein HemP